MRTAIIGLGVTGQSCLRYLHDRDELLVLDTRESPPDGGAVRGRFPDVAFRFGAAACGVEFSGFDRVLVSPGIGLDHRLVRRALAAGADLVSDIDLFCQAARAPVYAITGTNGKSTATALAGHLLTALGQKPGVGGNLGEPALDLLADDRDCYVLELSSFQLERMGSYAFKAAAILNVTEDHLDRHGTMQAYAASKRRIYALAGRAVANRADALTLPDTPVHDLVTFGLDAPAAGHWGIASHSGAAQLMFGPQPVLPLAEAPVPGRHNALNLLAAFALVAEPGIPPADLGNAAADFAGLPHRCQEVGRHRGVVYIDDSKATNVGATLAALAGLGTRERNLILIAGGDGKGADFAPLADPVGAFVKHVVLLGRDAPLLARALDGAAPLAHVADMTAAVAAAAAAAQPGDCVLLSPACASLDMFSNYAARGRAFAEAVAVLS